MADLPDQLRRERHLDLAGRDNYPWLRRGFLVALLTLVVLALLNVFGQHPTTSEATAAAASLRVEAPTRLRGGLIFQARFHIAARRALDKPTLLLAPGWFESMSVNSIVPNPNQQTSSSGTVSLTFDKLEAGQTLDVWIYYQANPINLGRRSQDVALADGSRRLLQVRRSAVVFP